MPNYTHPSELKPLLDELLEDPGHKALFDAYQADRIVGDNHIKVVESLESLQAERKPQYGMASKDRRSSKVTPGAPTPKGNSTLESFEVECSPFMWAEGISKLRGRSLAQVFGAVMPWLRDLAGHQVKLDVEEELMLILRGDGNSADRTGSTSQDLATGTRYWDDYAATNHNPVKNILDMQRITGATEIFLGSDVAHALMQSPVMIGDVQKTWMPDSQLITNLMGMGFGRVIIGHQPSQDGPREFPLDLKYLHDGICAMWSPGALKKYSFEAYQYDAYEDQDRRTDFVRAIETCTFKAPYAESVGVFKNILKP
jgi:hypothetical protein